MRNGRHVVLGASMMLLLGACGISLPDAASSSSSLTYADCPDGIIDPNAQSITAVSDGLLVLRGSDTGLSGLLRYKGSGCNLVKDPAYHPNIELFSLQVSTDANDHSYMVDLIPATGGNIVELDAAGNVVRHHFVTKTVQPLGVSRDGLTLLWFENDTLNRATRADLSGVFAKDPTFLAPSPIHGQEVVDTEAGPVFGGSLTGALPYKLFVLDPGGAVDATFGSADPSAKDGFSVIQSLVSCGTKSLCVVDPNSQRVGAWTGGALTGFIEFPGYQGRPQSVAPLGGTQAYVLRANRITADGPRVLGILSGLE